MQRGARGRTDAAFDLLRGLLGRSWYDNDDLLANDAEGVILQPRKCDAAPARVPLIVALHGGGGNVESWQDEWRRVADRLGAVVVLVRGTRVQGVGAFSYDQARPARDVARIEDWIARAKTQVPAIDEGDAFLAGFSQGGGMAWVRGVTGERAWRGIIPIGGYVQVAAREKVAGEPKHEVAAYAFVGERDEDAIRQINATLVSQQGLQQLRAKLEIMDGQAHVLPPGFPAAIARAMRWCRRGRP